MTATGKKDGGPNIFNRKKLFAFNSYRADTAADYEQKLQRMSTWDLAEEAGRHGIRMVNDRRDLIRDLVKMYKRDQAAYENIDSTVETKEIPLAADILRPFVR
jgi:hypothetical protein